MSLGARIKHERESKRPRMSQAALGKLVGMDQSGISDLETNPLATTKKVVAIAKALGVRPEWLETGRGEKHDTTMQKPPADGWVLSKAYNLTADEIRLVDVYRESHGVARDNINFAINVAEKEILSSRTSLIVNDKD